MLHSQQIKPQTIGITLGDVAGIGPEIVVAAWEEIATLPNCRPVVLGHAEIVRRAVNRLQLPLEVVSISSRDFTLSHSQNLIPCLTCISDNVLDVAPGTVDARSGRGAFDALTTGIDLALNGSLAAIVTAPLHKEALRLAGLPHPGHTEILAERCGVSDYAMMLYSTATELGLAIVHVTLHQSMRSIWDDLTVDAIVAKSHLVDGFVRSLTGVSPRIGVCALNPHCGEHGLFGNEEIEIISPAVSRATSDGLTIAGPFPADTLMVAARRGDYDAIVAIYHDQGHIALKLLGMHHAVNVTLGLPIIRTSVAHGTAFDVAWRGVADHRSLVAATRVALQLAERRDQTALSLLTERLQ